MNEWREVLIHVRRGDEFLVAHRSPDSGSYWHTIAGGVEEGEKSDAAAIRELREETGLEAGARADRRVRATSARTGSRSPACASTSRRSSSTSTAAGSRRSNEEHDEYRWLPRDEAAELLFWPEPAQLLRALP